MPLPSPRKGEKQSDFISRCMSDPLMKREYTDIKQRVAICHNQWRKGNKEARMSTSQNESGSGNETKRILFHLDADNDHALSWIQSSQKTELQESQDGFSAIAVIGDRIYKGKYLPGDELEKAVKSMDGAFHDINHWGTSYPVGLYDTPNIEWIVGYQKGTRYDRQSKQLKTTIVVSENAPKYPVWKNYVDICKQAKRTPNVSVSFWASQKDMRVKDLPDSVNYRAYGFSETDTISKLYDIEFRALSTVFQGACDDKAGCGIGVIPTYNAYNADMNTVTITVENQEPVDPNIKEEDETMNENENENNEEEEKTKEEEAKWTRAFINDLPDAAFAYIEPGGEKDDEGKTTPRSLRHFPHHGMNVKSGSEHNTVDLPHLRNALARAPQSPFGNKALPHLKKHAKALNVGDYEHDDERVGENEIEEKENERENEREKDKEKEKELMLKIKLLKLGGGKL